MVYYIEVAGKGPQHANIAEALEGTTCLAEVLLTSC